MTEFIPVIALGIVSIIYIFISIISAYFIGFDSKFTGIPFLFIYLAINSINLTLKSFLMWKEKLKLFRIENGEVNNEETNINEKALDNLPNFEIFSRVWFDLITWMTIIGGLTLLMENTKDPSLNAMIYVSYFLLYCYIADIIISRIGGKTLTVGRIILDMMRVIAGKHDTAIFEYKKINGVYMYIAAFFAGIGALIILTWIYTLINQIATKLKPLC